MKLLSSDIEKKIKGIIKECKRPLSTGLVLVTLMNAGSIYAAANNKKDMEVKTSGIHQLDSNELDSNVINNNEKVVLTKLSNVGGVKGNDIAYSYVPVMHDIKKNYVDYNDGINNQELVSEEEDDEETNEEEVLEEIDVNDVSKYEIMIGKIATIYKEIYDKSHKNVSKSDLLKAIITDSVYDLSGENSFEDNDEEMNITMANIEQFTDQQIFDYICKKYDLEDWQLKVIISVVYHEADWTYDDAYRVTSVIYNRSNSKVNYLAKTDPRSMYYQVIAKNQFQGYVNSTGSDYEELLRSDPDRIKLYAIFDCLVSEISAVPFDSFKSSSYSSNDYPGATDWIRYTKRGNVYHSPLSENDMYDGYAVPSVDEFRYELTREAIKEVAKEREGKKRVK